MKESSKTALAVLFVVALALVFWLALLAPKRDKAGELAEQRDALSSEVAGAQAQVSEAIAAKEQFPSLYRQLVLLGKAVPGEAGTPSLMVQLNGVGHRAKTSFLSIAAGGAEGESSEAAAAPVEEPGSLVPLGAVQNASGLPSLSYTLEFTGGFFAIADFLNGLDSLVETKNGEVVAKGRLVNVDQMTLEPPEGGKGGADTLTATFQVSTYTAPTGQGLTAGATAEGPAGEEERTALP